MIAMVCNIVYCYIELSVIDIGSDERVQMTIMNRLIHLNLWNIHSWLNVIRYNRVIVNFQLRPDMCQRFN